MNSVDASPDGAMSEEKLYCPDCGWGMTRDGAYCDCTNPKCGRTIKEASE